MKQPTFVKFHQKLADKWSTSYINSLFDEPETIEINPVNFKNVSIPDFPVVVTHTSEGFAFLEHLHELGHPYGVVLMSDETLSEPYDYLDHPECVFCLRQYVHPELIRHPKVTTIPLGYTDGLQHPFGFNVPRASERRYTWSFAGSLKADRGEAIDAFSQLKPYQLNIYDQFHDPAQLTSEEYSALLKKSKFIICPQGGCNIDSFRIYEALTCGAIPVVMKNHAMFRCVPTYWHLLFQKVESLPFIVADDWPEAAHVAGELLRKNEVETVQQKCLLFWTEQTKILKQIIALKLLELFEST